MYAHVRIYYQAQPMSTSEPYTIVLCVDNLSTSQQAINQAFSLCKRLNVAYKLHVLHVDDGLARKPSYGPIAVPASAERPKMESEIYEHLTRLFNNECDYDLTILKCEKGKAAQKIEQQILEHWPLTDLLIVGTRNQKGLKK